MGVQRARESGGIVKVWLAIGVEGLCTARRSDRHLDEIRRHLDLRQYMRHDAERLSYAGVNVPERLTIHQSSGIRCGKRHSIDAPILRYIFHPNFRARPRLPRLLVPSFQ